MYSAAVAIIILLIIFGFCFRVIKRRWIDKKYYGAGTEATTMNVYMQMQNASKKKSIEHVLEEEETRKQDFDGNKL
jgi:hypothetical protein